MKLVIFGLTISSSWGNGHATLWRGLVRSLVARGHDVVFFERDTPYYAAHRDLHEIAGCEIVIYPGWREVQDKARHHLEEADVAIVTSYCCDALCASELVNTSRAFGVFYDLDAPVTLARISAGEDVPYIGERGLRDYSLVLSYTGGATLGALQTHLGARRVASLYGSVDPDEHRPAAARNEFLADLSYLGTYAADRQRTLTQLLLEPARIRPSSSFVIAGAQYPADFPWEPNVSFVRHLAPADHPAFFSSSRLTLNVTREAMARSGYCPSGRLFEAAACGVPIISDRWEGLEEFFEPGSEIIVADSSEDVIQALDCSNHELQRLACASRERVLEQHTAAKRAEELEGILERAVRGARQTVTV
jgi:spore maturation protein CgeB